MNEHEKTWRHAQGGLQCWCSRLCLLLTVVLLATTTSSGIAAAQDQQDAASEAATDQPASPDSDSETKEEEQPLRIRPAYESPRATLKTFMSGMERAAEGGADGQAGLRQALSTFTVDEDLLEEEPEEAARHLKAIIDRLGGFVEAHAPQKEKADEFNLDAFSYYPRDTRNGLTSKALSTLDFRADGFGYLREFEELHPEGRIELIRIPSGEWRFSPETIIGIRDFYRNVVTDSTSAADVEMTIDLRIRQWFPESLRRGKVVGIEYWQWISLFVLIFAGVVLDFTARFIFKTVVNRIIRMRGASASSQAVKGLVRPLGLLIAGLFWLATIQLLGLPKTSLAALEVAIKFITMVAGVWAAYRVIDVIGESLASKAELTDTKVDDLLVPMLRKTVKVFVTAFGLIYIAEAMNIEILPLLTGLGIGGVAIAFASKDTVENFFGSVAVIVDRPFEVGDWIETNGVEGTVEALNFRSTRVRTFYNSQITIPNSNLVRAIVDNYGRRKYRRYKTVASVTYDTPPERIEAFCEGIREIIRQHPYTRKDYFHVWLNAFSASSLDILVYMFFETPDWGTELRERHRFMLDIVRLADQLGVEFAFPTQTLHLHEEHKSEDDEMSAPQVLDASRLEATPGKSERLAQRFGVRAARRLMSEAPWYGKDTQPMPVDFGPPAVDVDEEDDQQAAIEDRTAGG